MKSEKHSTEEIKQIRKQKSKLYRDNNKQKINNAAKIYREKNKDKIKLHQKEYRQKYKDDIKKYKQIYNNRFGIITQKHKNKYRKEIRIITQKYYEKYKNKIDRKIREFNLNIYEQIKIISYKICKYNKNKRKQSRQREKNIDPIAYLCKCIKQRCVKYNIEYDEQIENFLKNEYVNSDKCRCFNFKIQYNNDFPKYNSISIDRVNNNLGYCLGNVQLVSFRANSIKKDASIDELTRLINFLEIEKCIYIKNKKIIKINYDIIEWAKQRIYSIRYRCKKFNIPFNIDYKYLLQQYPISERCPVFGIELKLNSGNKNSLPSIDRIDPAKGYVKGNIQIISWRANSLKNDATILELKQVLSYYKKYLK